MDTKQKHKLNAILEQLSDLNGELQRGGNSRQVLRQRNSNGETVIGGNVEGLIYFSSRILSLCLRDDTGAHEHFDAFGGMDECDTPIVVVKEPATWDA